MKNFYILLKKIVLALILALAISNTAQSSVSEEDFYLSSGSFAIRNTEVNALKEFTIDNALRNRIDVTNEIETIKSWFNNMKIRVSLLSLPEFQANTKFIQYRQEALYFYENILAVFHDAYSNKAIDILKEMRQVRVPEDAFAHKIPTNDEKISIDSQLAETRRLMCLFSTIVLKACDINDSYGIIPITDSKEKRQFAYYLEPDGTYSTSSFDITPGWNIVQFLTSDEPFPQKRVFMTYYNNAYYIAPTAGLLITYKSNYPHGFDSYEIEHQIHPHTCLEQSATYLHPKNTSLRSSYPVFQDIIDALKEAPLFQETGRGFLPIPSTEKEYQEADLALLKMALDSEDESLIEPVALMIEKPGLLEIEAAPAEEEGGGESSGSEAVLGETLTVSEADAAIVRSTNPIEVIQTRIRELEAKIRAQQEARSAAIAAGTPPSTKKGKAGKKGKAPKKGKRSEASGSGSVSASPVVSGSSSSSSLPEITGAMSWHAFNRLLVGYLIQQGVDLRGTTITGDHLVLRNEAGQYPTRVSSDTISGFLARKYLTKALAALQPATDK